MNNDKAKQLFKRTQRGRDDCEAETEQRNKVHDTIQSKSKVHKNVPKHKAKQERRNDKG